MRRRQAVSDLGRAVVLPGQVGDIAAIGSDAKTGRHCSAPTESPAPGGARELPHEISKHVVRCCALEKTLCRSPQQSA